jgi:hypothetical protein
MFDEDYHADKADEPTSVRKVKRPRSSLAGSIEESARDENFSPEPTSADSWQHRPQTI